MQILPRGFGHLLRSLTARNPLLRNTDRLEAVVVLFVFTFALIAVPIAGAVGTATHNTLAGEYALDRASRHKIIATVTGDGILSPEEYADENAATEAVVAAFGLWFTSVGIAVAVWTMLRLRLNRLRYAAWDREFSSLADGKPQGNE